ncbi:uncharacterized membrane protein YgaE (UPF0421/DUF939 family) [Clostridium acetobutylicum]|uniref:Uncharacterized conserved membrane protein, YGAE B.subtilis homolog n=1 Tax=Clostridium acetobutylicum (strain ATCC 824 / DSM 792 / JCM 1419 / IAM 19013 / LMG 5710 / NBRC 13948 / NRRL B-527 / VKM B-1787 / 2291 / W) TaxID=272562 RepID=Q97DN3_CLOAB|nr:MULTISPECIES: aromatic acid exporter family protein [Clostridium]AAK81369.1 Uncharacterized conserved membrane protein, YGAE B.subtilis homolog [Clostridium acetobutylicum ATCC 824]ADZ22480.1 Conserved hypothetical protein [Clostridium acetobutylicum EA 2018]AEI32847.1 hypothetical protein SMB_G3477 [Clostridium acetobutylicum DSM 1731]AWV80964.1 aromatic acid exporter family protein [Clostridium acetobutylicum]MBC2393713.1 aromatic acid exporter family protein [Clostridium acetobutylicum]
MWLGNKALRAGISASLCMLASKLLKLKYPFFAVLPAVIPLSTNLEDTIKSSGNRLMGSAIGAIAGILLASSFYTSNAVLTGIGIVIIIYICRFINWENSASIACLLFISVMSGIKGDTVLTYSLHRLLDTFIGIAIAATVNNLVFSLTAYSSFRKNTKIIYDNLLRGVQSKIFSNIDFEIEDLYSEINNLHGLLKIYRDEIHFKKSKDFKLKQMNLIYENIRRGLMELNIINSMEQTSLPNNENMNRLNKVLGTQKPYKECAASKINTVYNYHLEKLIKSIEIIHKECV